MGFIFEDLNTICGDDYWINLIYDFASFATFSFSTLYHWLHVRSKTHNDNCLCLDHLGIEINSYVTSIKFMNRLVPGEKLFDSYVMIQSFALALAIMLLYRCLKSAEYGKMMNTSFGANTRLLLCASHVCLLSLACHVCILYVLFFTWGICRKVKGSAGADP